MTRTSLRVPFFVLAVALSLSAPLAALDKGPQGKFYEAMRHATTREAYMRAEKALLEVAPGMSEMQFLETMKMQVLAHKGTPNNAFMDGYLAEASRDANRRAAGDVRHLVFGYVDDGDTICRRRVTLRDHKVAEVVHLGSNTDRAESR